MIWLLFEFGQWEKRERNPLKNKIRPSTAKGSTKRNSSNSKMNMELVAQTIFVQAKKSGVEILCSLKVTVRPSEHKTGSHLKEQHRKAQHKHGGGEWEEQST